MGCGRNTALPESDDRRLPPIPRVGSYHLSVTPAPPSHRGNMIGVQHRRWLRRDDAAKKRLPLKEG
jgi:hypothetical protein